MTETHGRRLIPPTIDRIAEQDPDHIWASVSRQGGPQFEEITIAVLANAINRFAHWIVENVGPGSADGKKPVLAYIGPSDLRYYVVPIAIIKAGYVPLFTSHLNSKAANTSLLHETECVGVLGGFDNTDNLGIDAGSFKIYLTPGYHAVWEPEPAPPFPFTKSFDDAFHDPFMILHTSGSTGMPKPITYTHGSVAATDARQDVPDFEGFESEPRVRATMSRHFVGLPPFHAAGFASGIQDSVLSGVTIVLPPADRPLNARTFIDILDHGRIESAALLPNVLEDVARTPEALERLHKLHHINWIGGPISQQAGDAISARTTLINNYGSTEMSVANTLIKKDPSLWQWFFFHPLANGFDFRPVPDQDNVFELFVVRDPALPQFGFRVFPHLDEWPTRDLFTPHPTLPHYWRLVGRSDNLIAFHDGSKLNLTGTEAITKQAAGVKDAVIFGNSRRQPGILIEPVNSNLTNQSEGGEKLLDEVFSSLETSNRDAPKHGIVVRGLLLLTKPEKPLPRTGKQTVQRLRALDMYKEEIDALYEAFSRPDKK